MNPIPSLAPHHERGIEKAVAHYSADPHTIAIVLHGSLVRGTQMETSDVDLMVILDEQGYAEHSRRNCLAECLGHLCDYKGGYVDSKFFPKDFLIAAAERGSEPTRHSFLGARTVFSRDDGIEPLLADIGRYPEHERADKIFSFFSSLQLASNFFWGEALKRDNVYLKTRVIADVVLLSCRLILAHNRVLFPNHKWMFNALADAPEKPPGMQETIDAYLASPNDATLKQLVEPVKSFKDWAAGRDWAAIVTRFCEDNEQWWWKNRPNLVEW